jgi:hypothetical protein
VVVDESPPEDAGEEYGKNEYGVPSKIIDKMTSKVPEIPSFPLPRVSK